MAELYESYRLQILFEQATLSQYTMPSRGPSWICTEIQKKQASFTIEKFRSFSVILNKDYVFKVKTFSVHKNFQGLVISFQGLVKTS